MSEYVIIKDGNTIVVQGFYDLERIINALGYGEFNVVKSKTLREFTAEKEVSQNNE